VDKLVQYYIKTPLSISVIDKLSHPFLNLWQNKFYLHSSLCFMLYEPIISVCTNVNIGFLSRRIYKYLSCALLALTAILALTGILKYRSNCTALHSDRFAEGTCHNDCRHLNVALITFHVLCIAVIRKVFFFFS
jgi:hypothetical protein